MRSRFVGREPELAEIAAALKRARGGMGTALVVAAPAGMGKSRLVEEAAALAGELPVLWGSCREAGGAPAYFPWTQVLRGLQRRRGEPLAGAAARLLSPSVTAGAEVAARDRFLLHDAVVTALLDAAPLLVVLEDLHAADADSLELAELLASQVRSAGLLLVVTLRPDEGPAGLASALARYGSSIALPPLDGEQAGALLATLPAGARERAAALAEGHPLYLTELVRWAGSHDRELALPPTLRAAIEQRLSDLGPGARAWLDRAAVLGREVELPLLRALGEELAPGDLDEVRAAQILEEAGPGTLRFSHALVAEVLAAALPASTREALHLSAADALDREGRGRHAEIAHHLLRAGEAVRERAAGALERAGEEALAQLACADAVEHLEAALARTEEPAARVRRLVALGRTLIAAGEVPRGQQVCLDAAEGARALEDAELLADAALAYGAVITPGTTDLRLVSLLEEARGALDEGRRKALVLARLGGALQPSPEPHVPMGLAREGIALARAVDERTLLDALLAGMSALVDLADPLERRPLDRETVLLARKQRDPVAELRGHVRLAFDAVELADPRAFEEELAACDALVSRLPAHHAWRVAGMHAMWCGHRGDVPAFDRELARARALAAEAGDPSAPLSLDVAETYLLWKLGREGELSRAVPRVEGWALGQGALFVSAFAGGTPQASTVDLMLQLGDPSGHEVLAEIAVRRGDRGLAARTLEALLPVAGRYVSGGVLGLYTGYPAEWSLARLCLLLGREAEARERLERAHELCLQAAAVPQGIRVARDLALLLERTDPARATRLRAGADREAAAAGLSATVAAPAPPDSVTLARDGEVWTVRGGAVALRLRDSKGLRFLARLLQEPGRDVHVLDLEGAQGVDAGDSGEVIDARARDAYRRRLQELRDDLEERTSRGDATGADRTRDEIEALESELARALGLGGRQRRSGSAVERARINVQRRLRDAVERIAEQDPALGKHLSRSLRTGVLCRYEP